MNCRSLSNLRKRLDNFERKQNKSVSPPNESPQPIASVSTSEHPNDQINCLPLPHAEDSSSRGSPQAPRRVDDTDQHQDHDQVLPKSSTVTPQHAEAAGSDDADVSNLLVPEQPSYMSDYSGRLRYLGHSSTWSFSYQVLQMASQSAGLSGSPTASMQMHVDGQTYGLPEHQIDLSAIELTSLPSLELALYYLQSVKFRTHPLFHLFQETDFVHNLHLFYQDPLGVARTHNLWYIHYLVIMAFGKSFAGQQASIGPAGADLFSRAMNQMPDVTYLSRDPVKATEIFCCIALYLHCVDHRVAAHSYIGQAVRMAQSHGLHTDMQPASVGDGLAQHGRLLWWTVYILDQRLSSLMGIANGVHDDDISAPAPQISDNDIHTSALAIHVKISQLLGSITVTVYGPKAKLRESFLATIRKALKGIAELSEDLSAFSGRLIGEISRVAAHLNLQYNQCIILTVRPLLFHLYKQKLQGSGTAGEFTLPPSIKDLIQVVTNSAVQMANVLSQLKRHGLLGRASANIVILYWLTNPCFLSDILLPFDLEAAYSAAFVLVMASEVEAKHVMHEVSLAVLLDVFDTMIMTGNLQASSRKAEVEELAYSLRRQFHTVVNANEETACDATATNQPGEVSFATHFGLPSPGGTSFEGWSPGNFYPDSRIEGLADSLTMDGLLDLWV
ncbi:Zn(II)2Cys6 transcription factor [Fusarium bulbicola]|nr:Zn(II)2Cys6 transcription factor [Fusarium bulbicola]